MRKPKYYDGKVFYTIALFVIMWFAPKQIPGFATFILLQVWYDMREYFYKEK